MELRVAEIFKHTVPYTHNDVTFAATKSDPSFQADSSITNEEVAKALIAGSVIKAVSTLRILCWCVD
jgi:hypothetical protein